MSGPRWMTLAISLGGLVLFAVVYRQLAREPEQSVGVGHLFLSLPFVLGAAISVLPMQKRTRIMFYWLTAAIMTITGAVTIFSGIGIYYAIAVIFFLAAAWMENESGEPFIPKQRGSITTNPRTLSHR